MKNIKYLVFLILLGSMSCKKSNLDLFPYNQIETSQAFNTQADVTLAINGMYSGLRTSDEYFVNGSWNIMADVLADNVIPDKTGPGRGTLLTFSEWRYTGQNTYGLFSDGYSITRRANAILENIDKFDDGPFKDNAKGEALALRAMVYFDMSRVYGKTYENAAAGDSVLPYITSTDPNILPSKMSVKDFYDQAIADLESAKTIIGNSNGVYRLNKPAVSALLSRVYLYKGDKASCITASNDALGTTPSIPSIANFTKIWIDDPAANLSVYFKVRNTKLDNVNSQGVNYYQTVSGQRKSEYVATYDFAQLYTSDDIRTSTYIQQGNFNGQPYNNIIKYDGRPGDPAGVVDGKVIRTAEVLLNRAEAYYRSGNDAAALADLVLLKSNRYSGYVPETLSGAALLDEIYNQRRLELAFEGDRFWDLKRRNLPVVRDDTNGDLANGGGIPFVFTMLPAGDFRFQLPYPQEEVNFNANLTQNPGY